MKNLKKGHRLQKDIFEAGDMSDQKSVKQMSLKMKKQTDYLAKQEESLRNRLQEEAIKAINARWGSSGGGELRQA